MQSGKAQFQEVGGYVAQDQKHIWHSNAWINRPDPGLVQWGFIVIINSYSLTFIGNTVFINKGKGREA